MTGVQTCALPIWLSLPVFNLLAEQGEQGELVRRFDDSLFPPSHCGPLLILLQIGSLWSPPQFLKGHIEHFGDGLLDPVTSGSSGDHIADSCLGDTKTPGDVHDPDAVQGQQAPDEISAACIFWNFKANVSVHTEEIQFSYC